MSKIKIPKYTLGEELTSSISHGAGALFSIVALILMLVRSVSLGDVKAIVGSAIFGSGLIIMYTMSTLYHSLSPRLFAKKVFRILDHCSIYLLIVGTYAPILLYKMWDKNGLLLLLIMTAIAIVGIVLNSVNIEKFKVFSLISYLFLGWIAGFSFKEFAAVIAKEGMTLIVVGGVLYTIGAVIYAAGKKKKYMHSLWHFFVLAGSILHFVAIYLYILK